MASRFVTLPTGLRVPRKGVWLHQSCPDAAVLHYRNADGGGTPPDMDTNGRSPTRVQSKCPTCGLWALWLPR
jgi:hypothetical protein